MTPYTCSYAHGACPNKAVVLVHFPALQAVTYFCEAHKEIGRQTFEEGLEIARQTNEALGLPPLGPGEGPQWAELVE